MKLLSSNVSQRRAALILNLNIKTVVRKFLYMRSLAARSHEEYQGGLASSAEKIREIQFDEMETFERSKCLPLSILIAVVPGTRKILGFRVASMPAKGPLAGISRKKYGIRQDGRAQAARELFMEIAPLLAPNVKITSDKNPRYPAWLKSHFPLAEHRTVKGKRGCVVGQGELKRVVFDPLFSFNHTAAMLRANVNRLARRTWCTTKRADRLAAHIQLYAQFHNSVLT